MAIYSCEGEDARAEVAAVAAAAAVAAGAANAASAAWALASAMPCRHLPPRNRLQNEV